MSRPKMSTMDEENKQLQLARIEALKAAGWTDELIKEYQKDREVLKAAGWTDELIKEYQRNLAYNEAIQTYDRIRTFELSFRNLRSMKSQGTK